MIFRTAREKKLFSFVHMGIASDGKRRAQIDL
jgi:hypothetical protein